MNGRLALVTGATSGIGHATAAQLARAGWGVIVHGRTVDTAAMALRRIADEVPGASLWSEHADLSSLAAVRALATRVAAHHGRLDALVNNAGLFTPNASRTQRRMSADGYELTWAVNYLAAFTLTTDLAAVTDTVVNVSSGMLARADMRWDDLQHERDWDRVSAYGQSKLALTMLTMELAARRARTGPRAVAVNPGYIDTRLVREAFGGPAGTVEEGASRVVRPLLDRRLAEKSGIYLDDEERPYPHPLVGDPEARVRLWALSERQVARIADMPTGRQGRSADRASQQ